MQPAPALARAMRRPSGCSSGSSHLVRFATSSSKASTPLPQHRRIATASESFATSSRLAASAGHIAPLPPMPLPPAKSSRVTARSKANSFTHRRAAELLYSGTTLPSRGRPLLPRRTRRELTKRQRQASKSARAASSVSARLGISSHATSPLVRIDRQFKTFKPLTPSLRWVRYTLNPHLSKEGPERKLTVAKRGTGGRNHHGHVTVRGRGGGHRRRLRMVDFYRWESGEQTVVRIEYDPGRSAHVALVEHNDSKKVSYILAPDGLRAGDTVRSYRSDAAPTNGNSNNTQLDLGIFRTQAIRPGNVLPLHLIPIGTQIHAISLLPTGPAKLVRSAGASGQLVAFSRRKGLAPTAPAGTSDAASEASGEKATEQDVVLPASSELAPTHAQIRLQSGEVRLVPVKCCAAIGRVSNIDHDKVRLGKAGRARWLGRKPVVRGVAMNKTDHPNGGGRGKSKSNKQAKSVYGHLAKGKRTRKPGTRRGNQMVIRERPRRNGKRLGKP